MGSSKSAAVVLLLLVNLFLFSTLGSSAQFPKASLAPAQSPEASPTTCPYLELGVCSGLLNAVVHPPEKRERCCSLIGKITGIDAAAVCLCRAFKARFFHIHFDIEIAMHTIFNRCGHNLPSDFQCKR
ncbi:14 kDa proline-rich protein DC2.15-like [Lotus japonicus]|uniref:14 kDa proline-rich protein DC2.15-like n=1 Tax=Lotus japonicus TaxID=34305 RepID=UPI00258C91CF|nr:14 kDa proline-rich protein DC2.15-like [Lotus japonicus]